MLGGGVGGRSAMRAAAICTGSIIKHGSSDVYMAVFYELLHLISNLMGVIFPCFGGRGATIAAFYK